MIGGEDFQTAASTGAEIRLRPPNLPVLLDPVATRSLVPHGRESQKSKLMASLSNPMNTDVVFRS